MAEGTTVERQAADCCRHQQPSFQGKALRLITFDADSVEVRPPESSDYQYADMQDRWRKSFGERVGLQFFQQSKRDNRTLHDREVRAVTRSGRTLIWDLGHGIDGVMQNRFKCNVTLTEE